MKWEEFKKQREQYDIGIWAAGYEERSRVFVTRFSEIVKQWFRVEFIEDRNALSAPEAIGLGVGTLLGGSASSRSHDGEWLDKYEKLIDEKCKEKGGPVSIIVDYSSMPRTVYGTFVIGCKRNPERIKKMAMVYMPGRHAPNSDGSRSLNGLRALIGTEGQIQSTGTPAYILGIGYDGLLAEAVIDLFSVSRFSVMYANPGTTKDAVDRVKDVNKEVLERADFIRTAPANSVMLAKDCVLELCDAYRKNHDTVVVPLGPKTHSLGALLASLEDPKIGFRFLTTGRVHPVDVIVPKEKSPYISILEFK